MDVSIIIINYNTKEITRACIDSVFKYTKGVSFEIILVDNASSDGSKELFEQDSRIRYIYETTNHGFGVANNIGAAVASGDTVFLLNSDTLLHEDSCTILYNLLTSMPKVGVVGPIMVDEIGNNNGSYYPFRNCNLFERIKFRLYQKKIKKRIEENFSRNGFIYTGYVSGAALMMYRDLFNKVGGFDPDFFMYYEEQDLQKRIADLGYERVSTNKTKIYHIHGFSSNNFVPSHKIRVRQKSLHVYGKKHFSGLQYVLFRFLNFVGLSISLVESSKYKWRERISLLRDEYMGYPK